MTRRLTAKELRNDEELSSKCDNTTIGEPFQINNTEWHTAKRVNTYLIDYIRSYERCGRIDEELWETYQEDFEGWTKELFTLGHKDIRSMLRDILKDNSINVGGTKYVSHQLFNILQEDKYREWPKEEIARQMKTGRSFNSYQNPEFCTKRIDNHTNEYRDRTITQPKQGEQQIQRRTVIPSPVVTRIETELTALDTTPALTTKALTDLSKLYHSENLKFGGEMYDILDAKLKIFRDLCRKADVQPNHYHEAFSTMLKGRAH
jgi:hypothetical protein